MACYDIGAAQLNKPTVRKWAQPLLDAFVAGAWMLSWIGSNLYWVAKPTVHARTVNGRKQLHREDGPAIVSDLEDWHYLNGVFVEPWLVETPAEQLDPARFATLDNAEVRREFVRKIGVERLCAKLGTKLVDRQGDYELHLVPLGGQTGKWPYLKMRNPSIGVYHMEAVPRDCHTVQAALNFRNGGDVEHIAPIS